MALVLAKRGVEEKALFRCHHLCNLYQLYTAIQIQRRILMVSSSEPDGVTLHTLNGEITYEEAADRETNVLPELTYWRKMDEFGIYLLEHKNEIEDTISRYLHLKGTEKSCHLPHPEWNYGSFNLCLPVSIINWKKRPGGRVMIRFPLPFKVGESQFPGNSDEKLRSEVATYAWIGKNCPEVPIPYLWGFSFAGGPSVSIIFRLLRRYEMKFVNVCPYNVVRCDGKCSVAFSTFRDTSTENQFSTWLHCPLPVHLFEQSL